MRKLMGRPDPTRQRGTTAENALMYASPLAGAHHVTILNATTKLQYLDVERGMGSYRFLGMYTCPKLEVPVGCSV